jgi:hypothetical protein
MPRVAPADHQPEGDERVGQVLADEVEAEAVEHQRQDDQDHPGEQEQAQPLHRLHERVVVDGDGFGEGLDRIRHGRKILSAGP